MDSMDSCGSSIDDSKRLESFDYWSIKKPAAIRKQENQESLSLGVKKCGGCGETQVAGNFSFCRGNSDGKMGVCKQCQSKRKREYRQKPEVKVKTKTYQQSLRVKAKAKEYNQRPEVKARKNAWAQTPEAKAHAKEHSQIPELKAKAKEYHYRYYRIPEINAGLKAQQKVYLQKPEVKVRNNKRAKDRRSKDVNFKLAADLRSRLYQAVKNEQKAGSAVDDLGCSIEFLRAYLEAHFNPGMAWDNYGKGPGKWNIDHIIPLSAFDLTNREQLLSACHYTNLQPLWSEENLSKGDKF